MPGEKLTSTNMGVFNIDTKPGASPVYVRQYRMDKKSLDRLKAFVEELKRHDIVERSFSPYNSPVFLRDKPGLDEKGEKRKRMVMNFVELNKTLKIHCDPVWCCFVHPGMFSFHIDRLPL